MPWPTHPGISARATQPTLTAAQTPTAASPAAKAGSDLLLHRFRPARPGRARRPYAPGLQAVNGQANFLHHCLTQSASVHRLFFLALRLPACWRCCRRPGRASRRPRRLARPRSCRHAGDIPHGRRWRVMLSPPTPPRAAPITLFKLVCATSCWAGRCRGRTRWGVSSSPGGVRTGFRGDCPDARSGTNPTAAAVGVLQMVRPDLLIDAMLRSCPVICWRRCRPRKVAWRCQRAGAAGRLTFNLHRLLDTGATWGLSIALTREAALAYAAVRGGRRRGGFRGGLWDERSDVESIRLLGWEWSLCFA